VYLHLLHGHLPLQMNQSNWKRQVGREIATWLSMPPIILGLHFESELGLYFEETHAWHNCAGPLNKRLGFRMLEIFDLYLGFEAPWWNSAVNDIDDINKCKILRTMDYLCKNLLVMNTTIGKGNYCVDYGKVVMSF
jgi:hypothetical protein